MNNTYLKRVEKIPFSPEELSECVKEFKQDILKKLDNIENDLSQNLPFTIYKEDIGCGYDNEFYFIFHPNTFSCKYDFVVGPQDPSEEQLQIIKQYYLKLYNKNINISKKEYKCYPRASTIKELLLILLKNDLKPYYKTFPAKDFIDAQTFADYLDIRDERFYFKLDWEQIQQNEKIDNIKEKFYEKLLKQIGLDINNLDQKTIEDYLLNCETIRCGMEPYKHDLLDETTGLWNFWADDYEEVLGPSLDKDVKIFARCPAEDVSDLSTIGIDFGTTSTVVVRDEHDNYKPMSIGRNNQKENFENPTMLKLNNLENFMKFYKMKKGRPNTKWDDLWSAHKVKEFYSDNTLSFKEVSSVLYQIKQWAANSANIKRTVKAVNNAPIITLKPISELVDNDNYKPENINPIEIYAYYIGLYLNNQLQGHGIYKNYYMAFPAKFSKETREDIRKSFEKGLKKSIPEYLLKDPKFELNVKNLVSEPEAYAACALQTLGFIPTKEEPVRYAIYDFGGGTSDFAYGYWRVPEDKNNDYDLYNTKTDGIETLGGENLLEGLAFEIFSESNNLKKLIDSKCYFGKSILIPNYDPSLDDYISDGLSAKKNMWEMVRVLRDYWEKADEKLKEYLEPPVAVPDKNSDECEFTVQLSSGDEDNDKKPVVLNYSKKKIYDFFSKKISEGADGFFAALKSNFFAKEEKPEADKTRRVNILLAGNASKSPIFQKIIRERIDSESNEISEKYKMNVEFKVFSPLGTEKVWDEMKELLREEGFDEAQIEEAISERQSDIYMPTGKTGVACGLFDIAKNRVHVIKHKADVEKFNFYLGKKVKRGIFSCFEAFLFDEMDKEAERGKPYTGHWYEIFDINPDIYEYYIKYTDNPKCLTGNMQAKTAKDIVLKVKTPQVGDKIFIQPKGSNSFIWIVANNVDAAKNKVNGEGSLDKITVKLY